MQAYVLCGPIGSVATGVRGFAQEPNIFYWCENIIAFVSFDRMIAPLESSVFILAWWCMRTLQYVSITSFASCMAWEFRPDWWSSGNGKCPSFSTVCRMRSRRFRTTKFEVGMKRITFSVAWQSLMTASEGRMRPPKSLILIRWWRCESLSSMELWRRSAQVSQESVDDTFLVTKPATYATTFAENVGRSSIWDGTTNKDVTSSSSWGMEFEEGECWRSATLCGPITRRYAPANWKVVARVKFYLQNQTQITNMFFTWYTFGLLFHPLRRRRTEKRISMWSWLHLYGKKYAYGLLGRHKRWRAIAIIPAAAHLKPVIAVRRREWMTSCPDGSFKLDRYSIALLISATMWSILPADHGDFDPSPRGFEALRRSNKPSMTRRKEDVGWLPRNRSSSTTHRMKSSASATDRDSVWAANRTFIICLRQDKCDARSLFAACSPSSSWTRCSWTKYCHWMTPPRLSIRVPMSPKKFLTNFSIWHGSKITCTSWFVEGCWNEGVKSGPSREHPNMDAVRWLAYDPSRTSPSTLALWSCRRPSARLMCFAWADASMWSEI